MSSSDTVNTLWSAAESGDPHRLREALQFPIDQHQANEVLAICARAGWRDGAALVYRQANPDGHLAGMRAAAQQGHPHVLDLFLSKRPTPLMCTKALVEAVMFSQDACVSCLLPHADLDDAVSRLLYDGIQEIDMLAEHLSLAQLHRALLEIQHAPLPRCRAIVQSLARATELEKATPAPPATRSSSRL